jgi:hypothetical protein
MAGLIRIGGLDRIIGLRSILMGGWESAGL